MTVEVKRDEIGVFIVHSFNQVSICHLASRGEYSCYAQVRTLGAFILYDLGR